MKPFKKLLSAQSTTALSHHDSSIDLIKDLPSFEPQLRKVIVLEDKPKKKCTLHSFRHSFSGYPLGPFVFRFQGKHYLITPYNRSFVKHNSNPKDVIMPYYIDGAIDATGRQVHSNDFHAIYLYKETMAPILKEKRLGKPIKHYQKLNIDILDPPPGFRPDAMDILLIDRNENVIYSGFALPEGAEKHMFYLRKGDFPQTTYYFYIQNNQLTQLCLNECKTNNDTSIAIDTPRKSSVEALPIQSFEEIQHHTSQTNEIKKDYYKLLNETISYQTTSGEIQACKLSDLYQHIDSIENIILNDSTLSMSKLKELLNENDTLCQSDRLTDGIKRGRAAGLHSHREQLLDTVLQFWIMAHSFTSSPSQLLPIKWGKYYYKITLTTPQHRYHPNQTLNSLEIENSTFNDPNPESQHYLITRYSNDHDAITTLLNKEVILAIILGLCPGSTNEVYALDPQLFFETPTHPERPPTNVLEKKRDLSTTPAQPKKKRHHSSAASAAPKLTMKRYSPFLSGHTSIPFHRRHQKTLEVAPKWRRHSAHQDYDFKAANLPHHRVTPNTPLLPAHNPSSAFFLHMDNDCYVIRPYNREFGSTIDLLDPQKTPLIESDRPRPFYGSMIYVDKSRVYSNLHVNVDLATNTYSPDEFKLIYELTDFGTHVKTCPHTGIEIYQPSPVFENDHLDLIFVCPHSRRLYRADRVDPKLAEEYQLYDDKQGVFLSESDREIHFTSINSPQVCQFEIAKQQRKESFPATSFEEWLSDHPDKYNDWKRAFNALLEQPITYRDLNNEARQVPFKEFYKIVDQVRAIRNINGDFRSIDDLTTLLKPQGCQNAAHFKKVSRLLSKTEKAELLSEIGYIGSKETPLTAFNRAKNEGWHDNMDQKREQLLGLWMLCQYYKETVAKHIPIPYGKNRYKIVDMQSCTTINFLHHCLGLTEERFNKNHSDFYLFTEHFSGVLTTHSFVAATLGIPYPSNNCFSTDLGLLDGIPT